MWYSQDYDEWTVDVQSDMVAQRREIPLSEENGIEVFLKEGAFRAVMTDEWYLKRKKHVGWALQVWERETTRNADSNSTTLF